MSIYLIALNEDSPNDWESLKEAWPDRHYILTDRLAFVAPRGISLTEDIAETLGMDDDSNITGLVIEWQEPCTGYNRKALWEWIRKIE